MCAKSVCLIDPAVGNDINLGDHIISESIQKILSDRCRFELRIRLPSLEWWSSEQYKAARSCDITIVGGTNLLSSNMNCYRQWKVNLFTTLRLRSVILMGVGWWQYQGKPNSYTRLLLRRILGSRNCHSVRDSHTAAQLEAAGIRNVINTSCPTVWGITPEIQAAIPRQRATDVLTTLTCYNQRPEHDRPVLQLLLRKYRRVYFWPQGDHDEAYARKLSSRLTFLPASLQAVDQFLERHADLDYVGTRLHGGIRAIQYGKRSLVLVVDNRAAEIGRDINLPVAPRSDIEAIGRWIESQNVTNIRVPVESIEQWIDRLAA